MKIKTTFAILTFLAGGALVIASHGEGCMGKKGFGPERMVKLLNLDATQQEQWKAKHEAMHTKMKPIFEKMEKLHSDLRQSLEAKDADARKVGELMLAIRSQRQAMRDAHDALAKDLRSILTPEQQGKFDIIHELHGSEHACGGMGSDCASGDMCDHGHHGMKGHDCKHHGMKGKDCKYHNKMHQAASAGV